MKIKLNLEELLMIYSGVHYGAKAPLAVNNKGMQKIETTTSKKYKLLLEKLSKIEVEIEISKN